MHLSLPGCRWGTGRQSPPAPLSLQFSPSSVDFLGQDGTCSPGIEKPAQNELSGREGQNQTGLGQVQLQVKETGGQVGEPRNGGWGPTWPWPTLSLPSPVSSHWTLLGRWTPPTSLGQSRTRACAVVTGHQCGAGSVPGPQTRPEWDIDQAFAAWHRAPRLEQALARGICA